ncbi:carbohydrate-binding module family 50 protein [Parathielavia appendiculata]|uniref:Carbohydrate-binding module family 50 protein n=1 Tax=Parathielavia appendiculata TaxID=2587402 RepID=A0AAN6TQ34_9PEZI|nr:carbohydrate-binding module family 50 protein [Parathielavia appendiculata]
MLLWLLFLGLLSLRPSQAQQVSFLNITAPYHNLTTTCINVLNSFVSCDPKILDAGRNGKFESDATLATVCTTTCTSSLTSWVRRVLGACASSSYVEGQATVMAGFLGQTILERQGQFCNAILREAITQGTSTAVPPSVACHTCAASLISTRLQMPIGATSSLLKSQYESFTSSCQISSMSLTPLATTTSWVTIAPTGTPSCEGTTYTIQSGDNCRSIALAQGIGSVHLLAANNLEAACHNFPTSGSVCIPSAKKCKPYQLKADLSDTCATIAGQETVTWTQIVSWNPELGEYCENIDHLAKGGNVICVSTPGGDWVNPFPEEPSTTTSEPETYFTLPPTEFASAPSPTFSQPYPMAGYVDPIANGSVLDCHLHRTPPVRVNATSNEDSYRCSDFAAFYGVSMDQLVSWNPSLASRLVNGDCLLWAGEQYCAQRDLDQSANITQYCVERRVAESGTRSTCDGFVTWYGLNRTSFLQWHPGLGPNCENFHSGHTYCTSVRHFRAPGTIATCTRWHMATDINRQFNCPKSTNQDVSVLY